MTILTLRRQQYLLALNLSFILHSAYAKTSDDSSFFEEMPIVLSASRLSQPSSEAPNAMTVIDRNMIVASGFRNIPDLFKLVPGMYASYYQSSQAIVAYHGATDQYARRMQVMIDGRSIYLSPTNTVDWANLPITIEDIERIEVVRGPDAASYGANSIQGVINIITRDAGSLDGKSLSITRGEKGINDIAIHFGKRDGDYDYRMSVAYTADNGYDNLSTVPNNLPPSSRQLLNNSNDSNQARQVNYKGSYHPEGIDRYDIAFGFNHDILGVGFNDKNPSPALPHNTNGDTMHDLITNGGFVALGWVRALDNADELSLRYSHTRQDQSEILSVYLGGVLYPNALITHPVAQSTQTNRDDIELQHTVHTSPTNRIVYGIGYRVEQDSGQSTLPPLHLNFSSSFTTNEFRLFAHDEWRFSPDWLLNGGAMSERSYTGGQNISPRVALNYHLTPQDTFRMGTSVAYRNPALQETNASNPSTQPGVLMVMSPTATSPGLMPERMLSREIGYIRQFEAGTLDLRIFADQLTNGVFLSGTRTSAQLINGLNGNYRGIEATFKHRFDDKSEVTFNLAREFASSNGPTLAANGKTMLTSRNPLNNDILSASTPNYTASLLYTRQMAHDISMNASYYYQGALQPFDRGSIDYQPVQRRVDLRIAKAFQGVNGINGSVALVLENVLNQAYTEYISTSLFNRRSFVTLTLNW